MKKTCIISLVMFALAGNASAQFLDSLDIIAGSTVTAASKAYQPLWMVANRWGTIANRQWDASTNIRITNKHEFGQRFYWDDDQTDKNFRVEYAIDFYNNNHFREFFLKEGFLKFSYKGLQLRIGRLAEYTGEMDHRLSSGSLGVSGNTLPIPQVGVAFPNYVNVPGTKGWVQFKGTFSHGWFGEDNYVKNSYLHQKSAYLRFGRKTFRFYAGLTHFVQWGGSLTQGPIQGEYPSRFKDFLRIVLARSGRSGDLAYQVGPQSQDLANGVGNHIIIPDFGFTVAQGNNNFRFYVQNIFDKGQADSANQRDRLDWLRIFGKDRLIGFGWKQTEINWINGATLEYIYTKHQGGPQKFYGRDEYYNNSTYRDGWQYANRIIGTPLFISQSDASLYDRNLTTLPADKQAITSNRVAGVHLGISGQPTSKISYRFLVTLLTHAGNYYNDVLFIPAKKQTHFLLEGNWQIAPLLSLTAGYAQDAGNISNVVGGKLGVTCQLR